MSGTGSEPEYGGRAGGTLQRSWRAARAVVVWACYLAVAGFVFSLWLYRSRKFHHVSGRWSVESLIEGTGYRPWVYRRLLPEAVDLLRQVIPEGVRAAIGDGAAAHVPGLRVIAERAGGTPFDVFCFLVADFLFLLGFVFVLSRLWRFLYRARGGAALIFPAAACLGLPLLMQRGANYFYDFPVLFFFTAGVYLVARGRFLLFAVLFVLATLNKETSILLVVPLGLHALATEGRRAAVQKVALVSALYGVIRAVMVLAYRGNRGHVVVNELVANVDKIWSARMWFEPGQAAMWVFLLVLILGGLKYQSRLIRDAALIFFPQLALYVAGGRWGEVRVFYEAYPFLFFMAYHNVVRLIDPAQVALDRGLECNRTSAVRDRVVHVALRWYAVFMLGVLAVVGVTRLDALVPSRFQRARKDAPIELKLEELSKRKKEGTRWNAKGNVVMTSAGVNILCPKGTRASAFEISVDTDDEYAVEFWQSGRRVDKFVLLNERREGKGLVIYRRTLSSTAQASGISEIRIRPFLGDGRYSLGHLRLEPVEGRTPTGGGEGAR